LLGNKVHKNQSKYLIQTAFKQQQQQQQQQQQEQQQQQQQ
jgi:hypothetical protein